MGVDQNFMTVYGLKVSTDFYDVYSAAEEDHGEFSLPEMTFDVMSGEYLILGPVIFRYCADGNDEDSNTFEGKTVPELFKLEADWRAKFHEYFPEHEHLVRGKPFELISFVHYT